MREVPGSFSSGSRGGGLAPSARACQLGGVNPGSAFSYSPAAAAAPRHGVLGWLFSLSTMPAANSRCRFCTIGRQSAQLAQKADGSLPRSVDRAHPLPKGGKLCSLRHHRTCPLRPPRCGTNMTTTEHRELAQILPPSLEGPPSANSSPERWQWTKRSQAAWMSGKLGIRDRNCSCSSDVFRSWATTKLGCPRGAPTTTDPGAQWPLVTPSTRWLPDHPLVRLCPRSHKLLACVLRRSTPSSCHC